MLLCYPLQTISQRIENLRCWLQSEGQCCIYIHLALPLHPQQKTILWIPFDKHFWYPSLPFVPLGPTQVVPTPPPPHTHTGVNTTHDWCHHWCSYPLGEINPQSTSTFPDGSTWGWSQSDWGEVLESLTTQRAQQHSPLPFCIQIIPDYLRVILRWLHILLGRP